MHYLFQQRNFKFLWETPIYLRSLSQPLASLGPKQNCLFLGCLKRCLFNGWSTYPPLIKGLLTVGFPHWGLIKPLFLGGTWPGGVETDQPWFLFGKCCFSGRLQQGSTHWHCGAYDPSTHWWWSFVGRLLAVVTSWTKKIVFGPGIGSWEVMLDHVWYDDVVTKWWRRDKMITSWLDAFG